MSAGPNLNAFLEHVLPAGGVYVYTWKRRGEKWMRQDTAPTLDLLAARVSTLSAQGYDTYFACSAYDGRPIARMGPNGRESYQYRTAKQVVGTKSFWIDIDVGPSKAYATVEDAETDFFAWLDEYRIPEPTIVYSGGGLHIYWTMDRVLGTAEWLSIARRLKAFCDTTELGIDPERTADIASVLRPPETLNFKLDAARPVMCDALQPEINVESFAALLPQLTTPERTQTPSRNNLDEFSNIYTEVPSYARVIGQQCQWLQAVGVQARGNVREPMWYAMLGLLAFAQDGEEIAHEWSSGHADYDYDETEDKMEQVRSNQVGPSVCARFEGEWREGCVGCPHRGKITTPLQLGRPQPASRAQLAAPTDTSANSTIAGASQGLPPALAPAALDASPLLSLPYFWTHDGTLSMTHTNPDSGESEVRDLYAYPVFVSCMRKGEITGTAFATITHWAPHDGWQEVNLPAGDLTATGSFQTLGNHHIEVYPTIQRPFTLFMSRAKQDYKETQRTDLQHETFGWKDDSFLIGNNLIAHGAVGHAGISEELKKYATKLKSIGELSAWSVGAQHLFAPGYEYQALAVLASLAAPLMRFAPYPGTIYSMVHSQSGRGKTFAVEVATSVWGSEQALWISHRDEKVSTGDTIKAQYRAMALFKNLPIIIDEMRETDPEKLRGFILGFTDGSPNKGLNRDGSMRAIFGSWQTVMLTTSNKSIVDIVTVNNDPAAASRVFEITAHLPRDADPARGEFIRKTLQANHGVAGVAFVQELMRPGTLDWVKGQISTLVDHYTTQLQARRDEKSGGDRFSASFLACCTIAAVIGERAGLFKADWPSIRDWAFDCWGRQRVQIEQSQKNSTENLSAFVREHWLNAIFVQDETRGRDSVPIERELFRAPLLIRYESNNGHMKVDRSALHKWCLTENIHFDGFASDLARDGILLDRNAKANLGAGTVHRGVGTGRVWLLDARHPAMSGEIRELSAAPQDATVTRLRAAAK